MLRVELYFDGGARPTNPGKGYGSYEVKAENLTHKSLEQEFGEPLTNNQAEYLSLIAGLKWLSHNADREECHLQIWTDSELVCRQVSGRYKARTAHIKELLLESLQLLAPFGRWQIKWHGRANNVRRFGH